MKEITVQSKINCTLHIEKQMLLCHLGRTAPQQVLTSRPDQSSLPSTVSPLTKQNYSNKTTKPKL